MTSPTCLHVHTKRTCHPCLTCRYLHLSNQSLSLRNGYPILNKQRSRNPLMMSLANITYTEPEHSIENTYSQKLLGPPVLKIVWRLKESNLWDACQLCQPTRPPLQQECIVLRKNGIVQAFYWPRNSAKVF